jgi:hypothetical protein
MPPRVGIGTRDVAFQKLDLLFAEQKGVLPGRFFETQQALYPGFEIVAKPYAADAGGTHGHTLEPKFVGNSLGREDGFVVVHGPSVLIGMATGYSEVEIDYSEYMG